MISVIDVYGGDKILAGSKIHSLLLRLILSSEKQKHHHLDLLEILFYFRSRDHSKDSIL
jgi:hypothetical protein